MRKLYLILTVVYLCWGSARLNAQCYGQVNFDVTATAGASGFPLFGNSTFTITTRHCNELIMIGYDGWNEPGRGPVTVDGNPATWINTANNGNSGSAMVYAYNAATAGAHTIICSTNGYNNGYYNNFAAAFYVTGSGNPITIASLTSTINTIVCTTGGSITDNITTTKPNSMIYCTCEINEGTTNTYAISWTGATFLGNTHTEDGIDAGDAYISAPTPGVYSTTATNSSPPNNGCGGLTIVMVEIPPPLCGGNAGSMTVTPTQVNPTCSNNNGSISLAVSGGTSPYTYSWNPAVSSSANATGLSGGTYTISVNDGACHDTTFNVVLPAHTLGLTASVIANDACNNACTGIAISTVNGGVSPYVYSWTPTGGNLPGASNLCAGTYTITVTDANSCSNSAAVVITQPLPLDINTQVTEVLCHDGNSGTATAVPTGGTSPYTYLWNPTAQTTPTAVNLTAGIYTVDITDINGCTASASATLTQPTQLMVNLTGPQVICEGESGVLTAMATGGTTSYSYSWTSGSLASTATVTPLGNTTYTCTVTDANGCKVTASILVDLGPPLIASISGAGSSCSGNPVALCGRVSGGTGGYTFKWEPGNLSGRCITVYPTSTTTYTLTVGDNCGGDTNVMATQLVNSLPSVSFQTNVQQGCSPLCVQFNDLSTVTGGNDAAWSWNFGTGDSSTSEYPLYCYTKPGIYPIRLTVTSDSGCSSSLTLGDYVSVYSHPATKFIATPQPTTILTPEIQFTDKTTDQYGLIYWFWNFGDNAPQPKNEGKGGTSNLENPAHTYSDTGTYCVRLVAMNLHGCTDTTTNCLVISPIFNFYIPSAFTPNGDGLNDVFQAKGSYITNFEMYIFDRWGKQLFHTTNINEGWNGTTNGGSTMCQEDTYIYQIYVTDSQNKNHTYVGEVNLLK